MLELMAVTQRSTDRLLQEEREELLVVPVVARAMMAALPEAVVVLEVHLEGMSSSKSLIQF
jgi:hypothetical protein